MKEEKWWQYLEEQKLKLLETRIQPKSDQKGKKKQGSTSRRRDLSSYHQQQKEKLEKRKQEILEYRNSMFFKGE